jgi:Na+/H+-translocating membrane pyrophosphatase
MTDNSEKYAWTGAAALAGAAIGSAALAAALLYASRRKERLQQEAKRTIPPLPRADEADDD